MRYQRTGRERLSERHYCAASRPVVTRSPMDLGAPLFSLLPPVPLPPHQAAFEQRGSHPPPTLLLLLLLLTCFAPTPPPPGTSSPCGRSPPPRAASLLSLERGSGSLRDHLRLRRSEYHEADATAFSRSLLHAPLLLSVLLYAERTRSRDRDSCIRDLERVFDRYNNIPRRVKE